MLEGPHGPVEADHGMPLLKVDLYWKALLLRMILSMRLIRKNCSAVIHVS